MAESGGQMAKFPYLHDNPNSQMTLHNKETQLKRAQMSYAGVVVADKPTGPTSFAMVAALRRHLRVKKVGHTGTLDPFASGVLPLCIGEATKLAHYLTQGAKEYLTVIQLGIGTDTLDHTGKIVEELAVPTLSLSQVVQATKKFKGVVEQIPPAYSAIKVDGERLYKLARSGQEVQAPPRKVHIMDLEVLHFSGDQIHLKVVCGPGTYIRSLGKDIGQSLGLPAHLISLRRTMTGNFTESQVGWHGITPKDAHNDDHTEELQRSDGQVRLIDPAAAVASYPSVTLSDELATRLRQGKFIPLAELPDPSDTLKPKGEHTSHQVVAMIGPNGVLVGMGRLEAKLLKPERILNEYLSPPYVSGVNSEDRHVPNNNKDGELK